MLPQSCRLGLKATTRSSFVAKRSAKPTLKAQNRIKKVTNLPAHLSARETIYSSHSSRLLSLSKRFYANDTNNNWTTAPPGSEDWMKQMGQRGQQEDPDNDGPFRKGFSGVRQCLFPSFTCLLPLELF